MNRITVIKTGDPAAPAVIRMGDRQTTVWLQQNWEAGEYAQFVQRNGCGHCCCAMAANLHGAAITPHEEYALCRRLWGEPKPPQGHYQSVNGIVKLLRYLGIRAEAFGVSEASLPRLHTALQQEKQVIFWSHPSASFPDNPFSANEHYVMAVGLTETGSVLIANSSRAAAPEGIQEVPLCAIGRALYPNAQPQDTTWGEDNNFPGSAGYVIVG